MTCSDKQQFIKFLNWCIMHGYIRVYDRLEIELDSLESDEIDLDHVFNLFLADTGGS